MTRKMTVDAMRGEGRMALLKSMPIMGIWMWRMSDEKAMKIAEEADLVLNGSVCTC